MIYNNERSSERRVRVGTEPTRSIIWNLDLRARREAPLLTRMVDMMPLLKTAALSEIVLDAEVAQSRPNLNTKGQGYIDDFEGSGLTSSVLENISRCNYSKPTPFIRLRSRSHASAGGAEPCRGAEQLKAGDPPGGGPRLFGLYNQLLQFRG